MVKSLEIPEPVKILFISLCVAVGAYFMIMQIPTTNYTQINLNGENITKDIQYSEESSDNYSLAMYQTQNLTKAAKLLNMSEKALFLKLWADPSFNAIYWGSFSQPLSNDTVQYKSGNAFTISLFNQSYFFISSPYVSLSKLSDFFKQNCTLSDKFYLCKYQDLVLVHHA